MRFWVLVGSCAGLLLGCVGEVRSPCGAWVGIELDHTTCAGASVVVSLADETVEGLTLDGEDIYFTSSASFRGARTQKLWRVAKDGHASPAVLRSAPGGAGTPIVVRDGRVFLTSLGNPEVPALWQTSTSGGPVQQLVTTGWVRALAADDKAVVWIEEDDAASGAREDAVWKLLSLPPDPLPGTTPTVLLERRGSSMTAFALGDDRVFVALVTTVAPNTSAGQLIAVPRGGDPPVIIDRDLVCPVTVALVGNELFIADVGPAGDQPLPREGRIVESSLDGSRQTTVVSHLTAIRTLAVTDGVLTWNEGFPAGSAARVASLSVAGGGRIRTIGYSLGYPVIAADPSGAYWPDQPGRAEPGEIVAPGTIVRGAH